jgi:hypothetical protein
VEALVAEAAYGTGALGLLGPARARGGDGDHGVLQP